MGLSFALDELNATGWSDLDSSGCLYDVDGRAYPSVGRVKQEFTAAGFQLLITRIDRFNCYRAEWADVGGGGTGAVVGHTEAEAAVYALAQLRRALVGSI